MKEPGTSHWMSLSIGADNISCFSGLPGGYRDYTDKFHDIRVLVAWYSFTELEAGKSIYFDLYYLSTGCGSPGSIKQNGYSDRCFKD